MFVGIRNRVIAGFRDIELLQRTVGEEVEFVTIVRCDSLDAPVSFADADFERAVVPPGARALLSRFSEQSQHHNVRVGKTDESKDLDATGQTG